MSRVVVGLPRVFGEILRLNRTLVRLYFRSINGEFAGFADRSAEAPGKKNKAPRRKCCWHFRVEIW